MTLTASDHALLAEWDAVETRDRIRAKDVSAREVLEGAIHRAEVTRTLGAIVAPAYDLARTAAKAIDSTAPFAGVPTFVKDLARTKGVGMTWGSCAAGDFVPLADDPIVTLLSQVGLVSLGKSACSEFGLLPTTEQPCSKRSKGSKPCRNPWDETRSPGGSSGGAAALVAAGVVPIAHGTDGGGSIRIPAACCGLVGFKPSRFRLDALGSDRLPVNIVTDGVVTRSVRDTVAFFEAIEHVRLPRKVPAIGPVAPAPAKPLRIAFFVEAPARTRVSHETRRAVESAAHACEALGHDVSAISCPFARDVMADFLRYWGFLAWVQVVTGRWTLHRGFDRTGVEPWTQGLGAHFKDAKLAAVRSMFRLRGLSRQLRDVMARGYDVILSPAVADEAPLLGWLAPDVAFDVLYERVATFAPFTAIHNAAGAPAIVLPAARTKSGLPIGVQFAAAPGNDRTLLELAFALEANGMRAILPAKWHARGSG